MEINERTTVVGGTCASLADAFYFDRPELRSAGFFTALRRYCREYRYNALVNFRLSQYAMARRNELYNRLTDGAALSMARLFLAHPLRTLRMLAYSRIWDRCASQNIRRYLTNISALTEIGPGFSGMFLGVSMSAGVKVGKNANLSDYVVLASHGTRAPVIGDNVQIWSSAVIVGGVAVGDNAVIAANALVVTDVPANSTVMGNPAKVVFRRKAPQTA